MITSWMHSIFRQSQVNMRSVSLTHRTSFAVATSSLLSDTTNFTLTASQYQGVLETVKTGGSILLIGADILVVMLPLINQTLDLWTVT
jgi:hypothetical protein